jgi:hypothetical protein
MRAFQADPNSSASYGNEMACCSSSGECQCRVEAVHNVFRTDSTAELNTLNFFDLAASCSIQQRSHYADL